MTDERNLVIDLVRHSGINAIAEECHRLAVARGKYDGGQQPYESIISETTEWFIEMAQGNTEREAEEMGDLLHAVLSIAHHRGIDAEQALRDAMQRNRERAKEGV